MSNPFDFLTHRPKLELRRYQWDELLKEVGQYHDTMSAAIEAGLCELLDLRLILEKDEEFREIYEAHKEEWSAMQRDAEDAVVEPFDPESEHEWDDPSDDDPDDWPDDQGM